MKRKLEDIVKVEGKIAENIIRVDFTHILEHSIKSFSFGHVHSDRFQQLQSLFRWHPHWSLEFLYFAKGHKKPNLNKKSPQTLNLTAVCTLTQQNELTPFCLHAIDDYVLMKTKTEIDVMKLDKVIGDQDSKFRMSSTKFKGSTYDVASTLKVNQKRIFNNSKQQEKIDIMLSPQLFPNCVLKSHQPMKCLLSPCSSTCKTPIIASLSSHGSLQLSMHVHDPSSNEVSLGMIAELSEIRKNSFSLDNFMKLSKLQEIMDELIFSNFDWCPVLHGTFRFIAAVAHTNEIIIYSISPENEVAVQKNWKFDEIVSELKWVVANDRHYLFIASSVGSLTRLSIELGEDGKVESFEKVDEIKGKLKIHISNIQSYCSDDSIVLLSAKSHSLEIFLVTSNDSKSITKYVGMSITGVTSVSNTSPEYLITTLKNKMYYLKFNSDLIIEDYQQVDNTTFMGLQRSKYSAYGIAASKNKVLIYTALYPQMVRLLKKSIFHSQIFILDVRPSGSQAAEHRLDRHPIQEQSLPASSGKRKPATDGNGRLCGGCAVPRKLQAGVAQGSRRHGLRHWAGREVFILLEDSAACDWGEIDSLSNAVRLHLRKSREHNESNADDDRSHASLLPSGFPRVTND